MNHSKLSVLVLMPVDNTFHDIYQLGIKETCHDLHVDCQRVSNQISSDNKLEIIYEQIAAADLIIADITIKNERVFFQMGYAFGIGKKPLLLASNKDDIPAEFEQYDHLIYHGEIIQLKDQLTQRLQWCLRNLTGITLSTQDAIEYSLCDQPLQSQPLIKTIMDIHGNLYLTLDYQNITTQAFKENLRFCLVVPNAFNPIDDLNTIDVAQGTARMILLGPSKELQAGESHSIAIGLCTTATKSKLPHSMELEIYSEMGIQKYPFTIIIE